MRLFSLRVAQIEDSTAVLPEKPPVEPENAAPEEELPTEDDALPENTLPPEVKDELFARGLKPEKFHEHAVQMMSTLDAKHANDAQWQQNIQAVKTAMQNYPMIHATHWENIQRIATSGITPAHGTPYGFEFDHLTGLDKVVYMRQGQAGGGGQGAVGVMIDPKKLDPQRFLGTKLGLMELKLQEYSMLHSPGDHSSLLDKQLQPFRESTIDFQSMPDVQARLLVDGYLRDHPNEPIIPEKVVENDKGVMEVKYVGTIPPQAIVTYFAGDKPLKDGKSAADHIRSFVPANKLIVYHGGSLPELSRAYRSYYAYKQASNWYKVLKFSQSFSDYGEALWVLPDGEVIDADAGHAFSGWQHLSETEPDLDPDDEPAHPEDYRPFAKRGWIRIYGDSVQVFDSPPTPQQAKMVAQIMEGNGSEEIYIDIGRKTTAVRNIPRAVTNVLMGRGRTLQNIPAGAV